MQKNKRLLLIVVQVFAGLLVSCSAQIGCQGNTDCQNGGNEQALVNTESTDEKRKFNPWGGKRAGPVYSVYDESQSEGTSEYSAESKRSFSPWAGKRTAQSSLGYVVRARDARADRKKTRFHPWHGKRSGMPLASEIPDNLLRQLVFEYIDLDSNKLSDKRGFSPWAGK